MVVCSQVRDDSILVVKFKNSKALPVFVELGIVTGSVLIPLLVVWVPYYKNQYGFSKGFCWIKTSNSSASNTFLIKFFYGYSLFEVTGLTAVTVALGLTITYCTLSVKLQNAKRVVKNLLVLLTAVIAHIVALNLLMVIDVATRPTYQLKMVLAVLVTLSEFILLVGYLSAFHITKLSELMKKLTVLGNRYNRQLNKEYGTFKNSSRRTDHSTTFFNVPYTGEFTTVSKV